jgi:hypothetical protein
MPVFGDKFIPLDLTPDRTLDLFQSFYVNKYIDYHANMTAPALASETAYITAFAHFLLSGPTLRSLCSAEPRQPRRALALSHALRTHLALYSALTLHTAAPSVHMLPHFLDISVPAHRTAFLHIGPLSRASPGVPLAPPVHIVPSLPYFPALTLVPGLLSYAFSI